MRDTQSGGPCEANARRAKQKRDEQSKSATRRANAGRAKRGDEQSKCATSKANARRVKQRATQQSKNAHFGRLPHGFWVVVCSMIAPVCAPAPSASAFARLAVFLTFLAGQTLTKGT